MYNKPCLSLRNVLDNCKIMKLHRYRLKELIKQKLDIK